MVTPGDADDRPVRWLVVGGGAAGCVIAGRLSEDPDREVFLLEGGVDHGDEPVAGDIGPLIGDRSRLRTDARVMRRPDSPAIPYHQGFGLGGGSLVNGTIVVDPTSGGADVDHLLPLEAPWTIGSVGQAVLGADPDAAPVQLLRRDGRRVTAADAYLRPVVDRDNLHLLVGTDVRRVVSEGRRVVGVRTAAGDEIAADRVVLCAGAIQTPALLLRSGIDVPGIGEGLQDHPAVAIALDLEPGAADPSTPAIAAAVERPGREILAVDHLPGAPGLGALLAALTQVTSVGQVTLPDPEGPPLVQLGQLATSDDRIGLAGAAGEALDLLRQPALEEIVRAAYVDDAGTPAASIVGDDDAILAWLPGRLGGYHHVAGSCRAGTVTDDDGAVRDHEGLFVCDASLLPGVPPTDPYLTVIRLAERLAARWRRPDRDRP